MSKGGLSVFIALLLIFFAAFSVMTIIRYAQEWVFPNKNLDDYGELPWDVFVELIGLRDTGDNANVPTKIVGVFTIFIGLIFFSSLVAFITNEFEARLQLLRKGKSLVVESNHTLILGFGDRIVDIIKELVLANESEKDAAIVVLSEEDKEVMDDYLREHIEDLKTTRVVTRSGSITNINSLKQVGVTVAKSVIILNGAKSSDNKEAQSLADSRIVKSILAVMASIEEQELPPVIVELHSEQYRRLAENLDPGKITTLNESDILARILVQTSRSIGLSAVYLNLVGFEGNEFYFYRPQSGWGNITFGELPFHFRKCVPLGIKKENCSLELGPSKDYKLEETDELIVLAEDDSMIQFEKEKVIDIQNINYVDYKQASQKEPEKHLVIGWNNKTPIALREYAKYVVPGSEVNLVTRQLTDEIAERFEKIAGKFPHVTMKAIEMNIDSVEQLKTLHPYEYHSISILAASGNSAEEIDARTLTILLELRQIFKDYTLTTGNNVDTELVAEIIDSEETDLVIKAGVKDFLLTNQFVSKILAQVSQEPYIMAIYRDLFSVEGKELYIKPISLYFPYNWFNNLTFADCVMAAQARDEVCIGVRIGAQARDKDANFGLHLAPSLDQRFNLTLDDSLITLAEDEG